MEGHSWKTLGTLPWEVCKHCGLIALHNDITQWCITKGCNHKDHPGYASQLAKAGKTL